MKIRVLAALLAMAHSAQYQPAYADALLRLDPELVAVIRGVTGAGFNRDEEVWHVPASESAALAAAVEKMRGVSVLDRQDLAAIKGLANDVALAKLQERGSAGKRCCFPAFMGRARLARGKSSP